VAGAALTEAIAQDRALSMEQAEREKLEHGVFDPVLGRPLPKASAVIDQIAGEIVRFVASLDSVLPDGISDVTLVGGSAQLDRVEELLGERTGLSVQRLGLPREEEGAGLVAGGSPVLFAPAIALALRGTARSVTDMNFRQDEFARHMDFRQYRRDFAPTAVLGAIVLALALTSFLASNFLASRGAGDVEAQVDALYQQVLPGQPVPDNPVPALREAVQEARSRAEFLGVSGGNLSALDVLQEISKRVPADMDLVLNEISFDGQRVVVRGHADDHDTPERMRQLLAEFQPLAQARVGSTEENRKTGRIDFDMRISLGPEEMP
jgi:cell division ATPase FtsA